MNQNNSSDTPDLETIKKTIEEYMSGYERRLVREPLLKPGTVLFMNPDDYLTLKPLSISSGPVFVDEADPPIRFRGLYDFPVMLPERTMFLGVDWDKDHKKKEKKRVSKNVGVWILLLIVLSLFFMSLI